MLEKKIHPVKWYLRTFFVYQLFLVKIDFDAILPFRHFGKKKVFVIQRLIVTKKSEFCTQPHFVVKKKLFFCEASKKNAEVSFFFRTLTFFVRKRVQELLEELSLKIALE